MNKEEKIELTRTILQNVTLNNVIRISFTNTNEEKEVMKC